MTEQLKRIREKLTRLREQDRGFRVFGASAHHYRLNDPLSLATIKQFESSYNLQLPEDYVLFITTLGNGGAGPYYGLERLENGLFSDLDYRAEAPLLHPSLPFVHTQAWNPEFVATVDEALDPEAYRRQYQVFEKDYYDIAWMNGTIAICNFGCGVSMHLVVTGPQQGYVWADDRSSDYGIYPSREMGNKEPLRFPGWYELWLDQSLNQLNQAGA